MNWLQNAWNATFWIEFFVPILASDSGKSYFASIFELHCLLCRRCEICARIRNVWRSNFREELERSWTYCTAWQQQSRWCPPRSLFSPKMSAVLEIILHPEKEGTLQIYEKHRILGDVLHVDYFRQKISTVLELIAQCTPWEERFYPWNVLCTELW